MLDLVDRPRPLAAEWDWQMEGVCRDADARIFFAPENERGTAKSIREWHAKRLCKRCPVVERCREYALDAMELYGVWGGMSERERLASLGRARTYKK